MLVAPLKVAALHVTELGLKLIKDEGVLKEYCDPVLPVWGLRVTVTPVNVTRMPEVGGAKTAVIHRVLPAEIGPLNLVTGRQTYW